MQETRPEDLTDAQARRQMKMRQEFFSADNHELLNKAMDDRLDVLKGKGEKLVRRVPVGRNDPCPCNSGRKFKKCCLSKIR